LWSLATCEKVIEWCHIGKAFPPLCHEIHRKYNVANLKYCTWPKFRERCIQIHQFLYDQPNVKNNSIILSILRMVYVVVALQKKVNWMTMRASSTTKIIIPTLPDIPQVRKFLDGGLGREMDHAVVRNEQVDWSCTSVMMIKQGVSPKLDVRKKSQTNVHG
jgi:hypothetical protein